MKTGAVFLAMVVVWAGSAIASAGPATAPANPPLNGGDIFLEPITDITLYLGDKFEFSAQNRRTGKLLDPTTLDWQINGHPANSDPADGTFTPGTCNEGPTFIYRAPMKAPAHATMSLGILPHGVTGPPCKGSVTVTDEKNWFSIDGDMGNGGPLSVTVVPDTKAASVNLNLQRFRPFRQQGLNEFIIALTGSRKDNPAKKVEVVMIMGPNNAGGGGGGTFGWTSRPRQIGVSIMLPDDDREFSSRDGSTTILKPRGIDPPGLVRGFFDGQMQWYGDGRPRYVTVHGHFAVPQK